MDRCFPGRDHFRYDVDLIYRMTTTNEPRDSIGVSGIQLRALLDSDIGSDPFSQEGCQENGVTFAHIFEALAVWAED